MDKTLGAIADLFATLLERENRRALIALLWLAVPFVAPVVAFFLPRAYVIEATSRYYGWMVGAAAAIGLLWFSFLAWLAPRAVFSAKPLLAVLALALLCGQTIGGLLLAYVNRSWSAPGSSVQLKTSSFGHTITTFRVVDGPQAGLPFSCGFVTWRRLGKTPSMVLRPGRLGLWWGELSFSDTERSDP